MDSFTPNLNFVWFFMAERCESSLADMEMVDEVQSQFKASRKLINFQKVMEKGEEDRISMLPDSLLIEILTRLPDTKFAIRTGTLSKRWEHVWTSVHTLIFEFYEPYYSLNPPRANPKSMSDFVSFVDKTLTQCRQLKLKKFVLITYCDIQYQLQLKNWIRYAISCKVEDFRIWLWGMDDKAKSLFDQLFFISSCFTYLVLESCILNPVGAISWKNLRSLRIYYMNLDEDMIENILSGSPVLETLVLNNCHGFKLINITSKSVKKLWFSGYPKVGLDDEDGDIIKINAPNISSLLIEDDLYLWKLLLVDVSSLVEAYLDYTLHYYYFKPTPKVAEEEMLKEFILNLRHVKELEIGCFCSKVLSRLEAKGFDFPSNVKFPDEIWSDNDSVESED